MLGEASITKLKQTFWREMQLAAFGGFADVCRNCRTTILLNVALHANGAGYKHGRIMQARRQQHVSVLMFCMSSWSFGF